MAAGVRLLLRQPDPARRTSLCHGHPWPLGNREPQPPWRDRTLGEDASRIRRKPGIVARLRSFALNILRANGVTNVSEALYTNALSLDHLLNYGLPKS